MQVLPYLLFHCLAFEFWTKDVKRIADGILAVALPPLAGRHYALHLDQGLPLVLGTDFHLSMGAVELSDVRWNEEEGLLSGTIARPALETGRIYVYVPERLDSPETSRARRVSRSLLALDVEASPDVVTWQVALDRTEPYITGEPGECACIAAASASIQPGSFDPPMTKSLCDFVRRARHSPRPSVSAK